VTDEEPIEEPDDAEHGIELTPEERERLKESMKRLRRTLGPGMGFKLPHIERLHKLAAEMANLPTFRLPESTLRSISVMSAFAAQQAKLFDAFNPALAAQHAWKKQFTVIDSDIFKRTALAQSNLNAITAHLAKHADFGLGDTFAKLAQQVAAQQSAWLKTMGPAFESLKFSFYPLNLRNIKGLRWEEVELVVMVDGIALYGVPRTSIANALIRADSAAKRRDILGRRWQAISADCRAAVEGCETEAVGPYVPVALAALDALDAGHSAAAQALAGALLDSMVNSYFGNDRYLYTPDKHGRRTNAAYDEFTAHEYIALAPIWQAWQKFFPDEGLPIPHTFSRNATAHTVSAKQYTKRNAVQSLMIASSLIYFFDREALRVEAA
jgi:hypothetical protein